MARTEPSGISLTEADASIANRRRRRLVTLVFAVSIGMLPLTLSKVEAQISLDAVLKDCERKTIVMGRDEKGEIVKVGERVSGYCQGVLEGVFSILLRNKVICADGKSVSPDFLLSAVLTYRAETKSKDTDLARVVESAFKRTFRCGN